MREAAPAESAAALGKKDYNGGNTDAGGECMLVHVVGHACTMDTIPALADGCEHMPMRIRCMGACASVMQCRVIGCQATCMM